MGAEQTDQGPLPPPRTCPYLAPSPPGGPRVVTPLRAGYSSAGEVLNCSTYEVAVRAAEKLAADKLFILLYNADGRDADATPQPIAAAGGVAVPAGAPSPGPARARRGVVAPPPLEPFVSNTARGVPRWLPLNKAEELIAESNAQFVGWKAQQPADEGREMESAPLEDGTTWSVIPPALRRWDLLLCPRNTG